MLKVRHRTDDGSLGCNYYERQHQVLYILKLPLKRVGRLKSSELLRERNAKRLATNLPLALGELSELFHNRVTIGYSSAIYVATPSEVIEESLRQWGEKKGLYVTTSKHYLGNILRISLGHSNYQQYPAIDARILGNGKLILRNSFSEA